MLSLLEIDSFNRENKISQLLIGRMFGMYEKVCNCMSRKYDFHISGLLKI